jgi:hypothetical protein
MFYISLLQFLKSKLLIYKVPLLPSIIVNNGNGSYFINSIDNVGMTLTMCRIHISQWYILCGVIGRY